MKIYFAGAIRGGRDDAKLYREIIAYLGNIGQVLTEHVGNIEIGEKGEITQKDNKIYQRDMKWLKSADAVVAEVTTPSLGVGYELGVAEKLNIPVLCLYRSENGKNISAMIQGNIFFTCREYTVLVDAKKWIDDFVQSLT